MAQQKTEAICNVFPFLCCWSLHCHLHSSWDLALSTLMASNQAQLRNFCSNLSAAHGSGEQWGFGCMKCSLSQRLYTRLWVNRALISVNILDRILPEVILVSPQLNFLSLFHYLQFIGLFKSFLLGMISNSLFSCSVLFTVQDNELEMISADANSTA